MTKADPKPIRLMERKRSLAREVILDAAEKLLRSNSPPDFSMRALCDEAGVSFTTPFNYFGNKNGIIQALAERLMTEIGDLYRDVAQPTDAIDRLFVMCDTAADVWMKRSAVNRFIGSALMAVEEGEHRGKMLARSRSLWEEAMLDLEGITPDLRDRAARILPLHCAIAFRGVMMLWIGEEIGDSSFSGLLKAQVATLMLGFVPNDRHKALWQLIDAAKAP
ncbi:TetR/AcrR family transcriptional regulator [Sphingomonas panacis]|nr:TetR/AcrR family transcriptional regulator [Sphingomonas panacis]